MINKNGMSMGQSWKKGGISPLSCFSNWKFVLRFVLTGVIIILVFHLISQVPSRSLFFQEEILDFDKVKNLPLTDTKLLKYIKNNFVHPPSKLAYNISKLHNHHDNHPIERNLFKNFNGGIFVEVGANDGLWGSNSIEFEMYQNWTGVLIEADPRLFRQLEEKQRKAWTVNACLSPYKQVQNMTFMGPTDKLLKDPKNYWDSAVGKLKMNVDLNINPKSTYQNIGLVTCFPMISIMAALDIHHIHLFSLDIEGPELKVLKTLPWDDSLTIDIIIVEHINSPEGREATRTFLNQKGYSVIYESAHDFIFRHSSVNYT